MKLNLFAIACASVLVVGCGGGSGGGSAGGATGGNTNTNTSTGTVSSVSSSSAGVLVSGDFSPDANLLATAATDATQLYVKPEFKFNSIQTVQLVVSAHLVDGTAAANTGVQVFKLSSLDPDVYAEEMVPDNLVYSGWINSQGQLQDAFESGSDSQYFALVVDAIGIQNQYVGAVNGGFLTYNFQPAASAP